MGFRFCVRGVFGSMLVVVCTALSACSAPSNSNEPQVNGGAGAGPVASTAGNGGSPSGGGTLAQGGVPTSGAGGVLAAAGSASSGGAGGVGGAAPTGGGGAHSAGAHTGGVSTGGVASAGSGSGGGTNATLCAMVKTEYAAELEKQLGCKPGVASQCTNKVAAAPGCECRVFIQPADPFAIEHLSNVGNGWYDADCSAPVCPAKCSTATAGTCQADSKSPLGGRCVTP